MVFWWKNANFLRHRRNESTKINDNDFNDGIFSSWKLGLVVAVIILCFAVLYPNFISPMFSSFFASRSTTQQQKMAPNRPPIYPTMNSPRNRPDIHPGSIYILLNTMHDIHDGSTGVDVGFEALSWAHHFLSSDTIA